MNITPMQMYWLTRLDGIRDAMELVGLLLITLIMVLSGWATASRVDNLKYKLPLYWPIGAVVVWFVGIGAYAFLPTTKEAAAIMIVPAIVNNHKVQAIPDKLMTLAEEWMEELRPKKK